MPIVGQVLRIAPGVFFCVTLVIASELFTELHCVLGASGLSLLIHLATL